MKLVFLSPFMTFGGAEKFLFDLLSYLEKHGHSLTIVSSGGHFADQLERKGVQVVCLPTFWKKNFFVSNIFRLRKMFAHEHVDVFVANSFLTAVMIRLAVPTGKHVFILHNPLKRWYMPIVSLVCRFLIPHIISISQFNQNRLTFWRYPNRRVDVILNGVDIERFSFRRLAPRDDTFKIGVVARLEKYKGHRYLIEAVAALGIDDLTLEFVGGGPELDCLCDLVEKCGMKERVKFLGPQSDVVSSLRQWDLFVLPSLLEAVPISILEAMSCGIPVIATDVGGVAEIIGDKRTGLIVPPGDSQSLAKAISDFYHHPELSEKIVYAARREIESKFDSNVVFANFERSLLSRLGKDVC